MTKYFVDKNSVTKMNNFLYIWVLAFPLSSVVRSESILPAWLSVAPVALIDILVNIHHFYKLLIRGNIFQFRPAVENNSSDIRLKYRKCILGHCSMHISQIHVWCLCKSQSVLFLFHRFQKCPKKIQNFRKFFLKTFLRK